MTDLMELVDAYAEARHAGGCWMYNIKTAAARKAVEDFVSSIGAGGVERLRSDGVTSSDINALKAAALILGRDQYSTLAEKLEAMIDRTQSAQAVAEPMTRFCPGCGSVGSVDGKYRDCCPDGMHARLIPQSLAEKCRNLFQLAIDGALAATEALPTPKAEPTWSNTRNSLSMLIAGIASNPLSSLESTKAALDAATEYGMPLAYLRGAVPASAQPAAEPVAWLHTDRLGGVQAFTTEPPPGLKEKCQPLFTSPAPAPNALDAETAIKNCLEAGETMRVLKRVVNLPLESRRNLGPEDHELRDRIDQLFRPDAAIAAQTAQGGARG